MPLQIRSFFDPATHTVSHLVWRTGASEAVVIDPVLDFDPASGVIETRSIDRLLEAADAARVRIAWVLETHAHADHLSGSRLIKARTGAAIGIGEHIVAVQAIFAPRFEASDVAPDGADFDRLFSDGARIEADGLEIEVLHTPGHTPADVSYRIDDAVFVGDTLFMPDYGTARTDFPGGDATQLYRSIQRLLDLPAQTRLFMCHDYKAPGRDDYAWQTTVAEQRARNIHVRDGVSEAEFVAMRQARDAGLAPPALLLPSIQVNIRAGRLPPKAPNGTRYLKLPLRAGSKAAASLFA